MLLLSEATAKAFKPLRDVSENDTLRLQYDDKHNTFILDAWRSVASVGGLLGAQMRSHPSQGTRTLIQSRLIECKQHKDSEESSFCYHAAATDINCELINELFPSQQLQFADETTNIIYRTILARSAHADQCARNLAAFKADGTLPDHVYDCHINSEKPLSGYQLLPLANLMLLDGFGLFMDMGTGKTPTVIARICNAVRVARENGIDRHIRVLVVCPINARANWQKELSEFATCPIRATVIRGTPYDRVRGLIDVLEPDPNFDASVGIIGYDSLVKSWTDKFNLVPWDIAVADEGHLYKGPDTARFKTMMKLRDNSEQRIPLTGTPMANTVADLYAQLEFMGRGYSGFNSFTAFKKFYIQYEERGDGTQSIVGVQHMPFMHERLARYSYHITLKEALPNLPEVVNDIYECEMTERQANFYNTLRNELLIQIEEELSSGKNKSIVANCILTQLLRLAQITSGILSWGAEIDEDGDIISAKEIEYIHPNPKLEGLCDLIAGKPPTSKTIIWTCFTPDVVQISDMLTYNGYDHVVFQGSTNHHDRELAEYRFNHDDNCRFFVGNSLAGGAAVNLLGFPPHDPSASECNADHSIYFSQNWSRTARAQSARRNYRRGTRVQTRETDLVIGRTIDEEIRARVVQKTINAIEVSDIRDILQKLSVKL